MTLLELAQSAAAKHGLTCDNEQAAVVFWQCTAYPFADEAKLIEQLDIFFARAAAVGFYETVQEIDDQLESDMRELSRSNP